MTKCIQVQGGWIVDPAVLEAKRLRKEADQALSESQDPRYMMLLFACDLTTHYKCDEGLATTLSLWWNDAQKGRYPRVEDVRKAIIRGTDPEYGDTDFLIVEVLEKLRKESSA